MSQLYDNAKNLTKKTLGTGYGNKEKALKTLLIVQKIPLIKQKQIIITMFNRAKFHKYQTSGMRQAMRVYAKWLKERNIKYSFKK